MLHKRLFRLFLLVDVCMSTTLILRIPKNTVFHDTLCNVELELSYLLQWIRVHIQSIRPNIILKVEPTWFWDPTNDIILCGAGRPAKVQYLQPTPSPPILLYLRYITYNNYTCELSTDVRMYRVYFQPFFTWELLYVETWDESLGVTVQSLRQHK